MVLAAGDYHCAVRLFVFLRPVQPAGEGSGIGFFSGAHLAVHAHQRMADVSWVADRRRVDSRADHSAGCRGHADVSRTSVCRAPWLLTPPANVPRTNSPF